ncbi:MAG: nucleotidyltransferase domain-containing protein [Candidatus Bathyarchaeia archaeon]|nr:nucleotidyltransferase domain-containing protein [Candidatus Bathyarchaeota archaeon]
MRLRDRDYIVGVEGILFRVLGYLHPPDGYVCEPEYAPKTIFKSSNPRAPRGYPEVAYFKFYGDEGLKFVEKNYPSYRIYVKPLRTYLVGVPLELISAIRKPQDGLTRIMEASSRDKLLNDTVEIVDILCETANLSVSDIGVFGSILHGFHNPNLSDIDLVIYGSRCIVKLKECLSELYSMEDSRLRNEYDFPVEKPRWIFRNYSLKEYIFHERRKMIYGKYWDGDRWVKVEFEPVKSYDEYRDEYTEIVSIDKVGWVKLESVIVDDSSVYFTPAVYGVEVTKLVSGPREALDTSKIVSYIDEFRLQAWRDEEVYVEGMLERVIRRDRVEYQVSLTYCDRYVDQVLKLRRIPGL